MNIPPKSKATQRTANIPRKQGQMPGKPVIRPPTFVPQTQTTEAETTEQTATTEIEREAEETSVTQPSQLILPQSNDLMPPTDNTKESELKDKIEDASFEPQKTTFDKEEEVLESNLSLLNEMILIF